MPVREKLLLVLPDGELYDYTCQGCNSSVGSKTEKAGLDPTAEKSAIEIGRALAMVVIDSDAHVLETNHTWDYMLESERDMRPRIVPTPNDS